MLRAFEAAVTDRDIGFIEVGQRAAVKIDAFNYMRYGSVAADLLTGERRVLEYVLQPVLRYASEGMRER
ncbi:hypothetical protein NUH88_06880 [Nisaea acidiphila]|uniref:AprE-like beta-barrel domain-containing protein n=1 Tax=Nisaea acidiphila TaxID=1862145 RepID=A0A9J7B165_9PROT|nr:hypothetical protein [Nisaea acidiphila]UUX51413.1 hypothetical protein NUH88_06880 [Nisaea acidiphila]